MTRVRLNEQEWQTLVGLAERLGIDVRGLEGKDVRFTALESVGHALGRAVAQHTTERLALAQAERITEPQPCPTCGRRCRVVSRERELETIDGPIHLSEPVCHCAACRRDFFPQRPALGLDQRSCSPAVVDKIVSANAEHKSAAKAQKMLRKWAEIEVGVPLITDLTSTIGAELREHLEQQAAAHKAQTLQPQYAEAPRVAAVSLDGGRIMTRIEAGRGVHGQAWKETKNACLMTMSSEGSEDDPHPELPACFCDRKYVEELVREIHAARGVGSQKIPESPAFSASPEDDGTSSVRVPDRLPDRHSDERRSRPTWRPEGLVRTCVSSMVSSNEFGPLVAGETQRRGFYDAARRAFLGDGQAWNWTLHAAHFSDFVAITDFVHPLGYLEHNQARMDYPTYRRQGLPVSTMIESLIKEINYRVKGTEKFWNHPEGADDIPHVRAAALSDDDRLGPWILNRPGSYFYRVSTRKEHTLAAAA